MRLSNDDEAAASGHGPAGLRLGETMDTLTGCLEALSQTTALLDSVPEQATRACREAAAAGVSPSEMGQVLTGVAAALSWLRDYGAVLSVQATTMLSRIDLTRIMLATEADDV